MLDTVDKFRINYAYLDTDSDILYLLNLDLNFFFIKLDNDFHKYLDLVRIVLQHGIHNTDPALNGRHIEKFRPYYNNIHTK